MMKTFIKHIVITSLLSVVLVWCGRFSPMNIYFYSNLSRTNEKCRDIREDESIIRLMLIKSF